MFSKFKLFFSFVLQSRSKLFVFSFLILSSLMLFLLVFEKISGIELKRIDLAENRKFAHFPDLLNTSLNNLPESLEDYFDDNLPLRTQIIYKYKKLWKNCLPKGLNMYIKGKESNFYINADFNQRSAVEAEAYPLMDNYRGMRPLSLAQLDKIKVYALGLNEFWKLNNAAFFLFLFPDKQSTYPEFLPDWVGEDNSWRKQLSAYLSPLQEKKVNFVDFTKIMLKNKQNELYNKAYDILHWNGNGLALFYEYLSKKLSSNSDYHFIPAAEAFKIVDKDQRVEISGNEIVETVPWLELNTIGLQLRNSDEVQNWKSLEIIENNNVENGVILLLGDSYIKATHQNKLYGSQGDIFPLAKNAHILIDGHYSSTSFQIFKNLQSLYQPNIVIEAFVEREAYDFPPHSNNVEFMIAGEILLNDDYLFITPEFLGKNHLIESSTENSGNCAACIVDMGKNPEGIDLGWIMPNNSGKICVMAKISSPVEGDAVFKYKQSKILQKDYEIEKIKLKKGINYLYMAVYGEVGEKIEVILDFSAKNEKYTIYGRPEVAEILEIDRKKEK